MQAEVDEYFLPSVASPLSPRKGTKSSAAEMDTWRGGASEHTRYWAVVLVQLPCLLVRLCENAPSCPRRHSDHSRAMAGLGVPHVICVDTTGVRRRLLEWDVK